MVGHHDAVDPVLERQDRVARALDALEQDRPVPVGADEGQLIPAQARAFAADVEVVAEADVDAVVRNARLAVI